MSETQKVDVLAVMDRALGDLLHAQVQQSYALPLAYVESNPAEFSAAIAAVSELIRAAQEASGWVDQVSVEGCKAVDRLDKALALIGARP